MLMKNARRQFHKDAILGVSSPGRARPDPDCQETRILVGKIQGIGTAQVEGEGFQGRSLTGKTVVHSGSLTGA